MSVEFHDYSRIVIQKMRECGATFLEEVGGELEAQTKQNTKVDTGKTKGSWEHVVNAEKMEVQVGSRYKNALWEEFGTGIYALNGDGRKNKWVYPDPNGKLDKHGKLKFYTTVGKKPRRALHRAYESKKNLIIREARRRFKEL